jgi:hypothetical protein
VFVCPVTSLSCLVLAGGSGDKLGEIIIRPQGAKLARTCLLGENDPLSAKRALRVLSLARCTWDWPSPLARAASHRNPPAECARAWKLQGWQGPFQRQFLRPGRVCSGVGIGNWLPGYLSIEDRIGGVLKVRLSLGPGPSKFRWLGRIGLRSRAPPAWARPAQGRSGLVHSAARSDRDSAANHLGSREACR